MIRFSGNFPARMLAVSGAAGLVIAAAAWAAPVDAATLHPASASTQLSAASPIRASTPNAKAKPGICDDTEGSTSFQVVPDLSNVRATGSWSRKNPTRVVFELKGKPSLGLNLDFSGDVNCTESPTPVSIPIGDTGLTLKLGPELSFHATGKVQANFTWAESIDVGFTINHGKFTASGHSLTSSTKVTLSGNGTVDMKLNLHAVIQTAAGIVGVQGTAGPDISATVTESGTPCWNGSYSTQARFGVTFDAHWFKKAFNSPVWQLGKKKSFSGCLDG
jgi:hypothetical protein